ncbi:MAG TPA: EAL domain-containing response regulator [Gammaproteobacteria bacterium]|nr:EAL domain-containing response regulator [Gammaproteobacteria bacterium]
MDTPQLLVIDDDSQVADFMTEVACLSGYSVTTVQRRADCEAYLAVNTPQVIILDLQMPEMDGVEFLRWLAERQMTAAILLISGADARVRNAAVRLGQELRLKMLGTMQKPVRLAELEGLLQNVRHDLPSSENLKAALEQRQFTVHYQPQIALDTQPGTLVGMEALVRWQRPGVGLVPPMEFIPLAERSGLIDALTEYVMEQALQAHAAWQAQGLALTVAVNVAPVLLDRLDLPDRFLGLVSRQGANPATLKLEITESGAMQNVAKTMDILTRLRLKNFALSMDDFGTGFSSLVQLYRMPFSELKIDKSFVQEIERNDEAKTIIRVCIDLARNLGLQVCAEGVESQAALQLLRGYGCTHAQGYYIGKPMPATEVPRWSTGWMGRAAAVA